MRVEDMDRDRENFKTFVSGMEANIPKGGCKDLLQEFMSYVESGEIDIYPNNLVLWVSTHFYIETGLTSVYVPENFSGNKSVGESKDILREACLAVGYARGLRGIDLHGFNKQVGVAISELTAQGI